MEIRFLFSLLILLITSSCLKKEIPIKFEQNVGIQVGQVEMSANYKYQVYYNLEENRVVGMNEKTAWDCAYHLGEDGSAYLLLNSAKAMYAADFSDQDYLQISDTTGFSAKKKKDHETGDLTRTALGKLSVGKVFLINRGVSESGVKLGFQKVLIKEVNASSIKIAFSNLDNSHQQELILEHDPDYNAIFFHFDEGKIIEIEPKKNTWDVVFTQYLVTFEEEQIDYLVVGCLQNRYHTYAQPLTSTFNSLPFAEVQQKTWDKDLNQIGYEWKSFNGTGYDLDPELNFLIQDQKGLYYNLRFVDFYNEQGEKGSPKFEYVQY